MDADLIINATVTLLVTIDPVGLAPLFLAVTGGMDRSQRREVGTGDFGAALGGLAPCGGGLAL